MKISDLVQKYDPSNQFDVLKKTYEQIEFAWNNKIDLDSIKKKGIESVILTGMGGSAISGDLLKDFFKDEIDVPFLVNRSYTLPAFANKNTLLIVSSYSGNTEETISVFNSGLKRKCRIVCITSGGKVQKIAEKNKVPVIKIQTGFHPRYALGLSFFSLIKIMNKLKIVEVKTSLVNSIIKLYKNKAKAYSKEKNIAFTYAEQLLGFIPVIYSADGYTSSVGYRLKCQFNENSKLIAFHNILPEMNHNEIVAQPQPLPEGKGLFKIINILDKDYPLQITKRFKISSEIFVDSGVDVVNLESKENLKALSLGEGLGEADFFKVRLMDLIYLCDWITYYAGVLRGFDPAEIRNIDLLKNKLK